LITIRNNVATGIGSRGSGSATQTAFVKGAFPDLIPERGSGRTDRDIDRAGAEAVICLAGIPPGPAAAAIDRLFDGTLIDHEIAEV